ncbi:2-hydroxy-3-oxopropionate reductase [Sphingomonas sp. BK481]|jgi:2-hydroxy-3-oxopropionate reductase|uniref:2-hydroxy-3-oxopropionate reductase n=1 Tax=Sphingomonas sp. BK481 TaxID=2586981 RepID=UPI001617B691|nr:2-hydroxy-3-oxopropionate reductase [Sphingomonas sp. BK481]MBB3586381.1 2-hydroxy-3-oxopropionate reductase [Sphingomonas sp. BK481]
MKIGFAGAGIMGRPMAGHLQAAGHELLLVQHRSPLPAELLAAGATVCQSAAELAAGADIVILMLPDTGDVEAALFEADGIAAGLRPGGCVIDMSSIDPIATRGFAARIGALGCDYVDAPVSGGEVGAKAASLTIMCGATDTAFARAEPLFQLMGKNITHVGPVGAGQVTKVANQIIVALNIEAVAEALLFAAKAGVDPDKVRSALMGGFAASRVLEVHGQRMIDRTFAPGFRIALHQKDLNLALNTARSLGMALPNTASAQQLFSACVARGGADWDHSAIVHALEVLADHEIAKV